MPDAQPRIDSFAKRLWLASERDQMPAGTMRRCVGAAGEPSEDVVSRYGSTQLYARPGVISLTKYNSIRYQYDGSALYKNGVSLDPGYSGSRLNFVKAPPALGVPDYLFLSGGGKRKKIDTSGTITNWGIAAPLDGMTSVLLPQETVLIDSMDTLSNPALNWNNVNCAVANIASGGNPDLVYEGTGSLRVTASSAPWSITKDYTATPLNMATYASGDISLQTDLISFWVYIRKPSEVTWMWVLFDVDDGTFKKNYYRLVVQVVSQTANVHAANANLILAVDADRWTQIAAPKSLFTRIGGALEKDWSAVKKVRIQGGNIDLGSPVLYFDTFQLYGGAPLGAGPAALQNGSTYKYFITFGNDLTGNDSNPNDTPLAVNNVALQDVALRIPISSDPQVTNRKLWRTTAGGALYFLLDTIHNNTQASYPVDRINDLPGQPWVVTPWQKTAVISAAQVTNGYYIDGGNGFYFKEVTVGPVTTGAVIPTWNVPQTQWSALSVFTTVGTTILPRTSPSFHSWKIQTPGTTGPEEPDWTQPSPITDGAPGSAVVWVDNGALATPDGGASWVCQGINAQQSLDVTELRLDNTVFPATAEDAAFFQGSMYVGRDSVAGQMGWVYISPPGRSEGYGLIINVGTDDDPVTKVVAWDERLWVLTQQNIYELRGTYPAIVPILQQGAVGTSSPFTVKATPYGIVRQTAEDIRIFNHARDVALGFEALAPIERGQQVENVAPFFAVIAEHTKDEMFFSDGSATFAFNFVNLTWRMVGLGLNALYYEDDTGIIQAATASRVLSLEAQGVFTDNGTPVAVEWQTPSVLLNAGALTFVKRVFLKVNCNGQILTPTILVDGNEYAMPNITGPIAEVREIPFQKWGYRIGFRLAGNIAARVEWSGCDWDIHDGAASSASQIARQVNAAG